MRRRKRTNWKGIAGFVLAALAALALALPFVVPLKSWFPQLESQLSQALGEPVAFDSLRAGLSPQLYLEAGNVVIGRERDVRAARLRLYPELLTLSEPTRNLRSIELDEVALGRGAIVRFFTDRAIEGGVQRIRLGRLRANRVKLDLLDGRLGEVDIEATFGRENEVTSLVVDATDRKFKLELAPNPDAIQIIFSAQDWQAPILPSVPFERIHAQGQLIGKKLSISEFTAGAYGGDLRGGLEISWGDGYTLSGRLRATRLDLLPLLQTLRSPLPARGTLDAELRFVSTADTAAKLIETMKLDGKFKLANGTLNDFDFPRVIQGAPRDGVRGGQTRFEQLVGNLQTGGGAYRFSGLRLTSGLMSAVGNIAVAENGQVSGAMSLELRGSAGVLGSTVLTGGTLRDPVLLPSGK
jgi:uncharacterized protein involved in outer membrane biogenesis